MTTGQDQREKLFRMLVTNPEVRAIVAKALELEDEGRHKPYFLGWAWHQIPVQVQKLKVLVEEGIVKVAYQSRSATDYRLADPELAREALAAVGSTPPPQEGIPPDLFDHIVGHDEVKYWLRKSLGGEMPVHFLLVGPPATAKTMFMEAVSTLPGAHYALGGSTSRAGIADFLLNFRPRFLIIDELDKMDRQDLSVLLSLMQTGLVARLKKGMRETERMTVWVLAGCNVPDRLPPELLSRFLEFQFKAYTKQEFLEVAVAVITRQLGKDPDLAQYIAERVSDRTRDVRQAIQLAKLCDNTEEVDRFEDSRGGRLL